jgi:hypothetical protein
MVAVHQDGQHQSGVIGPRSLPNIQNRISTDVQAITSDPAFRSRMARPAIEEQRVKIATINMTIQPPAR